MKGMKKLMPGLMLAAGIAVIAWWLGKQYPIIVDRYLVLYLDDCCNLEASGNI